MKTVNDNQSRFTVQAAKFDENRFGAMTIMMTFQSCLGSVAAMASLHSNSYLMLAICAGITMASNAAFISQAPAKWCLAIFYFSIVANTLILTISLLL